MEWTDALTLARKELGNIYSIEWNRWRDGGKLVDNQFGGFSDVAEVSRAHKLMKYKFTL